MSAVDTWTHREEQETHALVVSGPFGHRCPALDDSKPMPVGQSPGMSPRPSGVLGFSFLRHPESLSAHLVLGFTLKHSCLTWRQRARLRDRLEWICMRSGAGQAAMPPRTPGAGSEIRNGGAGGRGAQGGFSASLEAYGSLFRFSPTLLHV